MIPVRYVLVVLITVLLTLSMLLCMIIREVIAYFRVLTSLLSVVLVLLRVRLCALEYAMTETPNLTVPSSQYCLSG